MEEPPPNDFDINLELSVLLYLVTPPLWLSQGERKLLSVAAVASLFCLCLKGIGAGLRLDLTPSPLEEMLLLVLLMFAMLQELEEEKTATCRVQLGCWRQFRIAM